jgi:hypothetical protein
MNTGINKKALSTNKGRTAFLFLLAVLMLVSSCPFKRLLQTENKLQSSQQPVKLNGDARKISEYQNSSNCTQKPNITLSEFNPGKQQVPAHSLLTEQDFQSDLSIHYFLSGTQKQHSSNVPYPPSSVPLFLQHRCLLI